MATLIERQIEDWEKRGVIDAQVASALRADISSGLPAAGGATKSARRFSFFQVVAFFAAISLGAAVLIFIAANWDYIPRVVRAAGAMAVILAGFVAGALVNRRHGVRRWLIEEACYLVGGAGFIGGVALVGQMYHISGDARDAALLYAAGLGLSGFALRSTVLVAIAAGWMLFWHLDGPDADTLFSLQFLGFAATIAAGVGFATVIKAVWLRRLLYLAGAVGLLPVVGGFIIDLLDYLFDLYEAVPQGLRVAAWIVILALAGAALLAGRLRTASDGGIAFLSPKRAGVPYFFGLLAVAFLHSELTDDAGLIVASSLAIAFVLVALFAHGRDNQAIRYISYAVFVGEILVVYGDTVYSMIGTSGFFLALGIVLAAIAFVVYRLERLWKRRGKNEEAADV